MDRAGEPFMAMRPVRPSTKEGAWGVILLARILYWVGIAMAVPFVVLVGASILKIFSEGFQPQYVNSAFLGLFGAAFSYAVGFMLKNMLLQKAE
jgi:uncharacterized RDD family membrane protein YckC